MAGQTDQGQQPQTSTTPVPDLIERYRVRRDAWIAQADELARLRDEVRSSAEREAMEIVTAARRDVRKVIMEARRELLVLSAQVQAALGEASPRTDPAILLTKAGITMDSTIQASLTGSTDVFAPEDAVNEILNEVQNDMTALAEDAKALPLQAVPDPREISPSPALSSPAAGSPPLRPSPAAPPSSRMLSASPKTPALEPDIAAAAARIPEPVTLPLEVPDLNELASEALYSSYSSYSSPFPPGDAVPVPGVKRLGAFVGVFVGVGVVVVGITGWWLTHRNAAVNEPESTAASAAPSRPASQPTDQPSASASPAAAKASTTSAKSANLSLVGQVLREVWIRTTIDGRTDGGRTLTAGQVIDVSAEKSISLLVGDAGALVVSVNNGAKLPLGRDGEVVTRVFDVAKTNVPGATPSTAAVTPTPDRPASARPAPPIASAAPAVAARGPAPTPAPTAASGGLSSFLPTAPSSAQTPPVNPTAPAAPQASTNGAANQLRSAPPTPSANEGGSAATVVVAYARQWLDAYHREDRATLAALSTENLLLADERRAEERFPPGLADVTRTLDRVSVQIAADTAVLTAVMMEQSGSIPSPHVSPISQVWVLGGGQWKVRQARFVSEARLNQVFK